MKKISFLTILLLLANTVIPIALAASGVYYPTGSQDDVFQTELGHLFRDTELIRLQDESYDLRVGLRFRNIGILNNQTITNATLQVYSNQIQPSDPNARATIYGFDLDDMPTFSNATVMDYPITSNFVNWNISTINTVGWHSIEVTWIVREVLSRYGWASGNDLGLKILSPSGNGSRVFMAYDGSTTLRARLNITYALTPSTPPGYDYYDTYRGYDIYVTTPPGLANISAIDVTDDLRRGKGDSVSAWSSPNTGLIWVFGQGDAAGKDDQIFYRTYNPTHGNLSALGVLIAQPEITNSWDWVAAVNNYTGDGNDYVEYLRTDMVNDLEHIWYRKGRLNSNSTITWLDTEYKAKHISPPDDAELHLAISFNNSGHAVYLSCDRTSDEIQYMINQFNDGRSQFNPWTTFIDLGAVPAQGNANLAVLNIGDYIVLMSARGPASANGAYYAFYNPLNNSIGSVRNAEGVGGEAVSGPFVLSLSKINNTHAILAWEGVDFKIYSRVVGPTTMGSIVEIMDTAGAVSTVKGTLLTANNGTIYYVVGDDNNAVVTGNAQWVVYRMSRDQGQTWTDRSGADDEEAFLDMSANGGLGVGIIGQKLQMGDYLMIHFNADNATDSSEFIAGVPVLPLNASSYTPHYSVWLNDTMLIECFTDPNDPPDWIDNYDPDPDDPDPGSWDDYPIPRLSFKLWMLILGMVMLIGPFLAMCYQRPTLQAAVVSIILMLFGLSFLMSLSQF